MILLRSTRKTNRSKRKVNERTESLLARKCRSNPKFSAKQILHKVGDLAANVRTIKRTLKLKVFTAHRPMKSPQLNKINVCTLQWARKHRQRLVYACI